MSLSGRLVRPVATLVSSNGPLLRRCLHQSSDPQQSGNQPKAGDDSNAQKNPMQAHTGANIRDSLPIKRSESNRGPSPSPPPHTYKTPPWIRALVAMGLNYSGKSSPHPPTQQGNIGVSSSGSDGNGGSPTKTDSMGSAGGPRPPPWTKEFLDKLLHKKGHTNPQERKRVLHETVIIKKESGSNAKPEDLKKEAMDEILRTKYGIEDPEQRKRIIENAKTIDLNGFARVFLIIICLVGAMVFLQKPERDRYAHSKGMREKENATRREQPETQNLGAGGQDAMADNYGEHGSARGGQSSLITWP